MVTHWLPDRSPCSNVIPPPNSSSTHSSVVAIASRYRGPPQSANGGYTCGLIAQHLHGAARVRLHLPPPLDTRLEIRTSDASHALMLDDEKLVAEGIAAEPDGNVPAPVAFDVALHASQRYRWFAGHPFPGCFVCGPERREHDGLRIFPGAVDGRNVVAAPWIPDDSVCDAAGLVQPEIVWAALDCPSWFGVLEFESDTSLGLLGQLAARVLRRPAAGELCVAIGWSEGRDGRKLRAGAALYATDGTLLGHSSAVWIAPRP